MTKLSLEEKRLLKDPNWRLDNLYYIKDKSQRKVKFKKNSIQQILHNNSSRFDNVLKARQLGISTYYLLKKLDKTIFTENYTAAILSHKRDSMEKLFSIIRRAHKYLNPRVQPIVDKGGGSRFELRFPEMDSKIYCTMEAVSDTVNDLHISEMALMDNDERVKTSLDAVPVKDGIVSVETTPRGFNHYHDFYYDPDTIFRNHFFPWFLHEEYQMPAYNVKLTEDEKKLIKYAKKQYGVNITKEQIAFRRFKIKQKKNDLNNFLQEFPEDDASCFLASGDSAMDLKIVKNLLDNSPDPISDNGLVQIFQKPDKHARYVCGCDTAEGVKGDYSVAVVVNADTREQVATLRGHLKPVDFAHEVAKILKTYSSAHRIAPLLAVERNNHGHAVLLELSEHIRYENLYKTKDGKLGWITDRVTRPLMIDTFIEGVENSTYQLNCKETLGECLTLIVNNGKIEAESGKHDDCVIAASIALQMCIEVGAIDSYDNISKRILL